MSHTQRRNKKRNKEIRSPSPLADAAPPTDPTLILASQGAGEAGVSGPSDEARGGGCPGVVATRGDGLLAAAGIPAGELQVRATVDEGKVEGGSLTVGCGGAVRSAAADGFGLSPHRAASRPARATRCIFGLYRLVAPSSACSPLEVQRERRRGRWRRRRGEWRPLLLALPPGVVVERADQRDNHEAGGGGGGGGGAVSVATGILPFLLTPSHTLNRCRCPFYTQKYAHKKKTQNKISAGGRAPDRVGVA